MSDAVFAFVADWGLVALFVATFLSCLALPVPSSLVMLAGGAFTASGDLALVPAAAAALAGAVLGDQAGFALGRAGGAALLARLGRAPRRAALIARARGFVAARGGVAVFLSRWLASPLGPWVNLGGGAAGLGWARFTLAGVAGEVLWVALYLGFGRVFAANLDAFAAVIGNLSGALAAAAVALGLAALARGRRDRRG